MLIGIAMRVPMPLTAFIVAPENSRPVQNEHVAKNALLDVRIHLNEAFSVNMEAQFHRVIGFVNGLY